ncbi:phospholipase D-like domain-containing protein [Salsuginibacillus kocurii]|uniref:phospholipase D-like domain-containing protein n=1 Tax=Salsuginibacillus kocurii TaxID=427078 RepID=UPI0003812C19|nr:phospholipase D-like domain-containing protein [Salsuginibacillus kocurii]
MKRIVRRGLCVWTVVVMVFGMYRPLKPGLSFEGSLRYPEQVEWAYNISYEQNGKRMWKADLFHAQLEFIRRAEHFLVVDMFLFNDYYRENKQYPKVADPLTETLIQKKKESPDMNIIVITDPINTLYNSHPSPHLEQLKKANIEVSVTHHVPMRDSTPLYSALWRSYFQWFGQKGPGWLPNPLTKRPYKTTLRSYLKLLNIKANHRKVMVSEKGVFVSSANPHDASAYHTNVGYIVKDSGLIKDTLLSEKAVAELSGSELYWPVLPAEKIHSKKNCGMVQLVTEGKIRRKTLQLIRTARKGEELFMMTLYVSDLAVIKELISAANRGVNVRIILDQNQEAFGWRKIGLPNKPVAEKLVHETDGRIQIRWYETKGEQFHPKCIMKTTKTEYECVSGSANFTRRNLKDLNIETALYMKGEKSISYLTSKKEWMDALWKNEGGSYTSPFARHRNRSLLLKGIFYIQKYTNLSTY